MPTYRLMEDHGGGKMSTHISEDQKERERKRTEAIAAKEQAREKREQARKGGKGGNGKSLKDDMAAKKEAELREKKDARANRIKETEGKRAAKQAEADAAAPTQSAKYSKKEIMILYELFSEYDLDGEGSISVVEFKQHFKKRNEQHQRYDGKSKNFAERRAARAGLDLAALVEPMFMALDKDQSGSVTFLELVKLLYPQANEQDMRTFKEWVFPDKPVQKINYVLSAEQKAELKDMFRIIDTDRSGEVTVEELKAMFSGSALTGETGIDSDELNAFFAEADFDNSNAINLAEFEKLMISTGLYVPEIVESG